MRHAVVIRTSELLIGAETAGESGAKTVTSRTVPADTSSATVTFSVNVCVRGGRGKSIERIHTSIDDISGLERPRFNPRDDVRNARRALYTECDQLIKVVAVAVDNFSVGRRAVANFFLSPEISKKFQREVPPRWTYLYFVIIRYRPTISSRKQA